MSQIIPRMKKKKKLRKDAEHDIRPVQWKPQKRQ